MHNGNRVCAYDTKNKYGVYIFEVVETLKIAGQDHKLVCEECGMPVLLRAGDDKVPHFSHYSHQTRDCYYNSVKETEEHRKGKYLLYKYLKNLYPEAEVQVNYRFQNKRWADILVTFADGKMLVVEYQRKDIKAIEWKERHRHYVSQNIPDVWILSALEYNSGSDNITDKIKFFEELVLYRGLESQLYFFNTDTQKFKVVKMMEFKDTDGYIRKKELFSRTYTLETVEIKSDGHIQCDFEEAYSRAFKLFAEDMQMRLDNAKKEKEKREEEYRQYQSRFSYTMPKTPSYPLHECGTYGKQTPVNTKSYEDLKAEAQAARESNPNGPWYDSRGIDKWGICLMCGDLSKDWYFFDGGNNTCKCKKCKDRNP